MMHPSGSRAKVYRSRLVRPATQTCLLAATISGSLLNLAASSFGGSTLMNLESVLGQLREERDRLDTAISNLERLEHSPRRGPGRPPFRDEKPYEGDESRAPGPRSSSRRELASPRYVGTMPTFILGWCLSCPGLNAGLSLDGRRR